MRFLHSTFLNKDFSLDIVGKDIKIFTVILECIVEGSVSHFFDLGICSFFMSYRRRVKVIFYNFLRFT